MILSDEEVKKVKKWVKDELLERRPIDNTNTLLRLIETIESQQQELERYKIESKKIPVYCSYANWLDTGYCTVREKCPVICPKYRKEMEI